MGENLVGTERLEKWRNAFDAFDDDCDGFIEPEMIGQAIRAIGYNPTDGEIEDMVVDVGMAVNFATFMYIAYRHSRYVDSESEILKVFRLFDKEKTGKLSVDVIRSIFKGMKRPFADVQIEDILKQSRVVDGMVNYNDLVKMLMS